MNRNEKIKFLCEEYTKKHTITEQAAIDCLVNQGIYNSDGTLHEDFGDEKPPIISTELLKAILRQNIVTVTFTKVDGSEREMQCTLDTQYFETTQDEKSDKPKKNKPENIVTVYELNKGFRSFDINRLISYKIDNHI
jgi:hypothetical protein